MPICCEGRDDEFSFNIGDEITYSVDNKDYTIIRRLKYMVGECQCMYQVKACDPTNVTRTLQISKTDEDKMTITNCLDVLTKIWPNLEMRSANQFHSLIMNDILGSICDLTDGQTHTIKYKKDPNKYTLTFDGIEFTKNK